MSTHNIWFYEGLTKIVLQLSSNILICSSVALTSDCTILSSDSSPDNMPQCESSVWYIYWEKWLTSGRWKHLLITGERGGSVVECRTPEREVRGSRPTAAVLCPWARHFTPRKYWLITQEVMAPSRHDWKIVDWDVKPQHNQPADYSKNHKNMDSQKIAVIKCGIAFESSRQKWQTV